MIKIVSFNVRYATAPDGKNEWINRRPLVDAFIENCGADIICFQEVQTTVKEYFIEKHKQYTFIGEGRWFNKPDCDEICLIAVRKSTLQIEETKHYWLSDTPDIPETGFVSGVVPRACNEVRARVRENGKTFRVMNTHLGLTEEEREKQFSMLLKRVELLSEQGETVFLAGDLNEVPEKLKAWHNQELFDLTKDLPYTFTAYGAVKNKIDYIFVNRAMQAGKAYLAEIIENGVFISDHFPVLCEIEV